VSALRPETSHEVETGSPVRRAGLPLRLAYYAGVVLAVVFLVVSILSWSMPLGACALVLAVVLFKNLDLVGGLPESRHETAPSTSQK
jgi:hypothetical protein